MGKKLPVLLLLHFLTILCCLGQGAIEFKVQYLPETTYTSRLQNTVVSELSLAIGKDQPLQKQGSDIMIDSSIIIVTTGKQSEEGSFPITRHDLHHSKNEQRQKSIKETFYYGTCFVDRQPVFDSVYRENANPELQGMLLESIQKNYVEAQMPDTILSIGEQFSYTTRRYQSYMTDTIEFYITSTYQLKKVENGIAFFDVTLTYANPGINDTEVSGGGKGKVEYDITNHFETSYVMVMETNIEYRSPPDGMHLILSGKTNFSQTTEIIR